MTNAPLPRRPGTGPARAPAPALLDGPTEAALHRAVARLRTRRPREPFDLTLHVGSLDGPRVGFVVHARERSDLDRGVRTDLVARLLRQALDAGSEDPRPTPGIPAGTSVWLTRPGSPSEEDDDHAWHAAARSAYASLGRTLGGFWVVTRTGWLDLVTGERRLWTRPGSDAGG